MHAFLMKASTSTSKARLKIFSTLRQTRIKITRPSAICAANNDLLFCSDDESQYVFQVALTFDGVTVHGNATKSTAYPSSIVNLLSITLLDQCAFFSGASSQGGLYKCELSTNTVDK